MDNKPQIGNLFKRSFYLCLNAWARWYMQNESCSTTLSSLHQCNFFTTDDCKLECLRTAGCWGFEFPSMIFVSSDCAAPDGRGHHAAQSLYMLQLQPPRLTEQTPSRHKGIPIWPHPVHAVRGSTTLQLQLPLRVQLDDSLDLNYRDRSNLMNAFHRVSRSIFTHNALRRTPIEATNNDELRFVVLLPCNASITSSRHTRDGYTLSVPSKSLPEHENRIRLHSNSVAGFIHGLETLGQMISFDFTSGEAIQTCGLRSYSCSAEHHHGRIMVCVSRKIHLAEFLIYYFTPVNTTDNIHSCFAYALIEFA